MYGHGIPFGGLFGLMILIVLAIVIYRLVTAGRAADKEKTPREIVDERYAKGEITDEQYKQMKKELND